MPDIFTINTKLRESLEKIFQQHRLVFWYDTNAEFSELFTSTQISGVVNLTLDNNEFSVKHRLLVDEPTTKFLIYQAKAKPEDNENWLLDLLLSNYEFQTEASSLYLQDLDLSIEYKNLIQSHEEFFVNQTRIEQLKSILENDDTESKIRLKMLSVICNCDPEWEKVLYSLFTETIKSKNDKYKSIEKFNLTTFLWEVVERKYNYKSANPTVKDLILQLFKDNFDRSIDGKPILNKDAFLFVNTWKENKKSSDIFEEWSKLLEIELNIQHQIGSIEPETLLDSDTYSILDKKIIASLKDQILNKTISNHIVQDWINKRRVKFFFDDYAHLYNALGFASNFLDELNKSDLSVKSPQDGFEKYHKQWFALDRLYRKYIYSSEQAEHQNILKELTSHIEKAYGNSFLLKLSDNWQESVDKMNSWQIDKVQPQKKFYNNWVKPYVNKDSGTKENRIFVIISDALRYESASELKDIIVAEDRYTASLTACLGSIPSYTQLGMASLLPNKTLTIEEGSDIVYVDGQSSQGLANRTKILQKEYPGSIAISAEDFLKMKAATEGRDYIKPYNVIYIYSNHIDKIGDDKTSESKVFEATETEFDNIIKLIKHVSNMNGNNMIVTADHGYLYQHNRLDESDFTDFTPTGNVYKTSRRFVIGKELNNDLSVKKWDKSTFGLADDTEIQIPKSINRIRVQGAGSRFVHGGASLQEIVIPIIEINKARKSDIEQVEVDIISSGSNITSNTTPVNFYQKQPISDKIQQRQIRASFYTSDDNLISDVKTILFNSADDDAGAREQRQVFHFTSNASKYNGQDVTLKLEEQISGTNQYKTYKTITYRMLIAFTSEFDEF